jgi:hypothetical protein
MTGPKYNLEERLLEFAVRAIRVTESTPLVVKPALLEGIVAGADELVRIFAASIRTAESNREPRKKHER